MLSELSPRKTNTLFSLICGILKKNEYNKTETNSLI